MADLSSLHSQSQLYNSVEELTIQTMIECERCGNHSANGDIKIHIHSNQAREFSNLLTLIFNSLKFKFRILNNNNIINSSERPFGRSHHNTTSNYDPYSENEIYTLRSLLSDAKDRIEILEKQLIHEKKKNNPNSVIDNQLINKKLPIQHKLLIKKKIRK